GRRPLRRLRLEPRGAGGAGGSPAAPALPGDLRTARRRRLYRDLGLLSDASSPAQRRRAERGRDALLPEAGAAYPAALLCGALPRDPPLAEAGDELGYRQPPAPAPQP